MRCGHVTTMIIWSAVLMLRKLENAFRNSITQTLYLHAYACDNKSKRYGFTVPSKNHFLFCRMIHESKSLELYRVQ